MNFILLCCVFAYDITLQVSKYEYNYLYHFMGSTWTVTTVFYIGYTVNFGLHNFTLNV